MTTGVIDGKNLEIASTPLNRLEQMPVTGTQLADHVNDNTNPHGETLHQKTLVIDNQVRVTAHNGILEIKNLSATDYAELNLKGINLIGGDINQINRSELAVEDSFVNLNSAVLTGTPVLDGGIRVIRGGLNSLALYWNETLNRWRVQQQDGSNVYAEYDLAHLGDVYTKIQSDERFVNVTGDTMTGALLINPETGAPGLILKSNGSANPIELIFENGSKQNIFRATDGSFTLIPFDRTTIHKPVDFKSATGNSNITLSVSDSSDALFSTNRGAFDFNKRIFGLGFDAKNNTLDNLANPSSSHQAVNLGFADNRFVNATGDTMTGNLNINANLAVAGDFSLTGTMRNANGFIYLNHNVADSDGGLAISRDTSNAVIFFKESDGFWYAGTAAVNYKIVTEGSLNNAVNTETIQDIVGAMVSANIENGIAVTYDDATGKLNFDVNDPVITLTGDVTGSATMTNLGNVSIVATVGDDSHNHTSATLPNLTEDVQDIVGAMVTGNTENGVSVTYDDATGKLNFDVSDPVITLTGDVTGSATMTNLGNVSIAATVGNDSHTHTSATLPNLTEDVQDIVGAMVTGNTENGVSVTYDDATGKLNFDVSDPVITLTGDVTGSATMTNLGNVSITATVGDDSHNHTNLTGTTSQTYKVGVGNSGVAIKSGASIAYIRNEADTDYADLHIKSLFVHGPTIEVQSETMTVADNIVLLNSNVTGAPSEDAGLEIQRGTSTNARLIFNETTDNWQAGISGSLFDIARYDSRLNTQIQNITGAMVSSNTENGIAVTYDATGKKLNFDVNDFTITLTGDATGSATITNLANASLAVTVVNDSHSHTASTLTDITETVQDIVGAMVSSNTENGLAVTYDDATGKLNFDVNDFTITLTGDATGSATITNLANASLAVTVANDSHSHTASTLTDITETVQDIVGAMVSSNTENGIAVTYNDTAGKLNFDVNDFTITLTGDATGSATITNLANASLAVTVTDNSHNHTSSNISDFSTAVKTVIGGAISATGIAVSYSSTTGITYLDPNDFTITLTGNATGSATITNLANASLAVTVNDSAAVGGLGVHTTSNNNLANKIVRTDASGYVTLSKIKTATTDTTRFSKVFIDNGDGYIQTIAKTAFADQILALGSVKNAHTHNSVNGLKIARYESSFAGAGSYRTVYISGFNSTNYGVSITPTSNPGGNIGEYFVTKYSGYFEVRNSGTSQASFDAIVTGTSS